MSLFYSMHDESRQTRKRPRGGEQVAQQQQQQQEPQREMCQPSASSSSRATNSNNNLSTRSPTRTTNNGSASTTPTRRLPRSNVVVVPVQSQPPNNNRQAASAAASPPYCSCCFRRRYKQTGLFLAFGLTLLAALLQYPSLHAQTNLLGAHYHQDKQQQNGWNNMAIGWTSAGEEEEEDASSHAAAAEQELTRIQQRHTSRRQRIRPPMVKTNAPASVTYDMHVHVDQQQSHATTTTSWKPPPTNLCGMFASHAVKQQNNKQEHWTSAAPLTVDSKVVIAGIMSSEVGVQLALQLHQHCGVTSILGIDSMTPNLKVNRVRATEQYERLAHSIPDFQKLVVSVVGLQPFGKHNRLEKILASYKPTHIVHLPSVVRMHDIMTTSDDEYQEEEKSDARLYHRYERLVSLTHLLEALRLYAVKKQPHVLTLLQDDFCQNEQHVLINTYHYLYGVSMTQLKLAPQHVCYGYGERTSDELLNHVAREKLGLVNTTMSSTSSSKRDDHQQYIHVDDIITAIVSGMQLQQEFPYVSTFTIGNQVSVTSKTLQDEMDGLLLGVDNDDKKKKGKNGRALRGSSFADSTQANKELQSISKDLQRTEEWLGWRTSLSPRKGARKLLAWHLERAFPYGNGVVESRSRFKEVLRSDSLSTRPFACASECGYRKQCTSSVYDDVAKISRQSTRSCKYAVYMVDLSADTSSLPSSGTQSVDDPGLESSLCRVAFVSVCSALAQRVGKKAGTKLDRDVDVSTLSGIAKANGWTLFFVPGDSSTMTEDEYSLPKLSPSNLFSDSVTRAMYIEPDTAAVPSTSTLVDTMKLIDAPPRRAKRKKIYRSGTTIFRFEPIPAKAPRRTALFGGPYEAPASGIPAETSEMRYYAGRMMEKHDIDKVSSELKEQLQFYEEAVGLVQSKVRRPFLVIRNELYTDFPFQWVHSGMLIHDFREEEARRLRCEWYDEHTVWGNRHMEDLSLAYIIAKRRILGKHEPHLEDQSEWTAIRTGAVDEVEISERALDSKYGDMEMFIRILDKPIVFPAETRKVEPAAAADTRSVSSRMDELYSKRSATTKAR